MAITIQLTEVPENEQVPSRVFTVPRTGGDFGSSFDCVLQLPDRTGKVAAKHGMFIPAKNGMTVAAVNGHAVKVNGKPLASGRNVKLEDGLMIEVADYMLLVSEPMDQFDAPGDADIELDMSAKQPDVHFSLDDDWDNDLDLAMADEKKQVQAGQKEEAHFAFNGVLVDDPFDEDPFADAELSLQGEDDDFLIREKSGQNFAQGETVARVERVAPQQEGADLVLQTTEAPVNPQVDRLMALLETQVANASEQQNRLQQALDKTLDIFLDEFSPLHLEEGYSDFATPLFTQKEAQYWRQYRKSFNRRLNKGEYHRLFKAILLENMHSDSNNSMQDSMREAMRESTQNNKSKNMQGNKD